MSTKPQSRDEPKPKIFISYRREDTQQIAGRLYDRLVDTFGEDAVLKDVDSIPYGVDFRIYSTQLVRESRIVLVLIGSLWLRRRENGTRRIDDDADLVRLEVEASLEHCPAVIPVLAGDVDPPAAADLPKSIANLAYRHAARLRHDPDFRVDCNRLIRRLEQIVSEPVFAPALGSSGSVGAPESSTHVPSAAAAPRIAVVDAPLPERDALTISEAPGPIGPVAAAPETTVVDVSPPAHNALAIPETPSRVLPVVDAAVPSHVPVPSQLKAAVTDNAGPSHRRTLVIILAMLIACFCLLFALIAIDQMLVSDQPLTSSEPLTDSSVREKQSWAPERRRPIPPTAQATVSKSESTGSSRSGVSDVKSELGGVSEPPPDDGIPSAVPTVSMPSPGIRAGEKRAFGDPAIEFCWCPAGAYKMGSQSSDPNAYGDEKPSVDVTLTTGFWIGCTEATQSQWKAVMGTEPWKTKGDVGSYREGLDFPAVYISWRDAVSFCDALTRAEQDAGRLPSDWVYTLPTEAEWEYACRAGTASIYSFGDDASRLGDYAWFRDNAWKDAGKYARQVRAKAANPWGLFDMHGNVEEWCADVYLERLSGGRDPLATSDDEGKDRVQRGGACLASAEACRSALRSSMWPDYKDAMSGFRIVCAPLSFE